MLRSDPESRQEGVEEQEGTTVCSYIVCFLKKNKKKQEKSQKIKLKKKSKCCKAFCTEQNDLSVSLDRVLCVCPPCVGPQGDLA